MLAKSFLNEARFLDAMLVVLCCVALYHGVRATHDLGGPFSPDLHRDLGQARAIARGDYFSDPQFPGEGQWYNPLVPGIVGWTSRLTGVSPTVLYGRMGAYLNILGPVCFYLLLMRLFDRRVALFGAAGLIFVVGRKLLTPYAATYAPWLFSGLFTQAIFYLALACYVTALKSERTSWHLASGALLGLTFLGHAFPALVLGCLMLLVTAGQMGSHVRKGSVHAALRPLKHLGLAVLLAFVVSLPFSATVLFRYRLAVLNSAPTSWIHEDMKDLAHYLALHLAWATPIVALGVVQLFLQRRRLEARVAAAWIATIGAWLGYIALWQPLTARGYTLPTVTFSMHAGFYFCAAQALLFGLGLSLVVTSFLAVLRRATSRRLAAAETLLVAVSLAAVLGVHLPTYSGRAFFTQARERAQFWENYGRASEVPAWILANTTPDDVFLASDEQSLYLVVAAGRKIVATFPMQSNPYVDVAARRRDRDLLFGDIARGDWKSFFALAQRYRVTHVLSNSGPIILALTRRATDQGSTAEGTFSSELSNQYGAIFRVDYPG